MKRVRIILSIAMALGAGLFASAQDLEQLRVKYNQAGQLMTEQKYEEAATAFGAVIAEGGGLGEGAITIVENSQKYLITSLMNAAKVNASRKNFDKALELVAKAGENADKYNDITSSNTAAQLTSSIYLAMGGEAYNAKDYAKAAEVFAKGYEASPNNTQLALYLAESYDQLDQPDKAIAVYKGIIGLTHSRYAEAVAKAKADLTNMLLVRADKAAKENKYADVVKYADEILSYDPSHAAAHILPIQTANNAKNYAEVIKRAPSAIAALTDAGQKSDMHFFLGQAYHNTDNKAKAIEALSKVSAGSYVAMAKSTLTELNN